MGKQRAQASFFDGLMFMLITVISVTLIFLSLDAYSAANDKVLRTAYLSNYLQSSAKMLYYVDVSTLKNIKDYCNDPEFVGNLPGGSGYYCRNKENNALHCDGLSKYQGRVSVADLIKRDVDDSDGQGNFDDKFGTSEQKGRTALRCAMKEIMKPFTFSGYRYLTEIAEARVTEDRVIHATEEKIASDFIFSDNYTKTAAGDPYRSAFSCQSVGSDQLLVIRTPFKILTLKEAGGPNPAGNKQFDTNNYVLRTCLWPSNDLSVARD